MILLRRTTSLPRGYPKGAAKKYREVPGKDRTGTEEVRGRQPIGKVIALKWDTIMAQVEINIGLHKVLP